MFEICLVFWESQPQYAYKRYAYKKTCIPTAVTEYNSWVGGQIGTNRAV